jgi:single-stranded-DNA-specific exonuclease
MWTQRLYNAELAQKLTKEGVLESFATIIAGRDNGIVEKTDIGKYAAKNLKDIDKPYNTAGMEKAVKIVKKTATNAKCAVIFGDYDVDGITSSVICTKMLFELGFERIVTYLPNRIDDGYGLNDASIKNFINKINAVAAVPELIMILDCGTSSEKQIRVLKSTWNVPIIVVDHHIIEEADFSKSADAVVNYRLNDSHPFCTAGSMYQFARAALKPFDSQKYIMHAAIGTVADVCMMQGSNRIIVHNGIAVLKNTDDCGLSSLLSACNINRSKIDEDTIGFSIAPVLNAAGRLADPMVAYELLTCIDSADANRLSYDLVATNERRKDLQREIIKSVEYSIKDQMKGKDSIVAIGDWHGGIVGIVAGQLAEKHNVPVICFGRDENGRITGSGRSKTGIHIKKAMDNCSELFSRYGGHEQAAGATLKPECIDTAWDLFDAAVKKQISENKIEKTGTPYDVKIDISQFRMINTSFCERLAMIGPFGQENRKPIFRVDGITCKSAYAWSSNKGGGVVFQENDIDSFAMVPDVDKILGGKRVDILFTIERSFKDSIEWSIKVQNARLAGAG